MEKDPKKVKKLAGVKEDENQEFINFLRNCDHHEVDKIVHSLNKKHLSNYDCTSCANCCKQLIITITEEDIVRIAEYLDISSSEFKKTYVKRKLPQGYTLDSPGCPFLDADSDKCTIYECRPEPCSSFPHLYKDNINHRLINIMDNTYICPIIYNLIEELKEELSFEYKEKEK